MNETSISTSALGLEGTWEEVATYAPELAGRRVRVTVLAEPETYMEKRAAFRPASGRSLLRHLGKWQGEDFEKCLNSASGSRGSVEFRGE
jgi:hypothetical protein